jgi:hypothetical protein
MRWSTTTLLHSHLIMSWRDKNVHVHCPRNIREHSPHIYLPKQTTKPASGATRSLSLHIRTRAAGRFRAAGN